MERRIVRRSASVLQLKESSHAHSTHVSHACSVRRFRRALRRLLPLPFLPVLQWWQ
jgi:hypothetical protein